MLEAKNLHIVGGPLARQKLKVLRDENTRTPEFRQAMKELALIVVAEATHAMPTKPVWIRTPLAETDVEEIAGPVCLVPVLRAGLGMLEGALALLPDATVGFMGLQRDEETAEPVEYYVNLPRNLQEYGAHWVSCLHAVAAAPGVERVTEEHPEASLYTAAVDPELDERAFIVPGLGDAGDRLYGTL